MGTSRAQYHLASDCRVHATCCHLTSTKWRSNAPPRNSTRRATYDEPTRAQVRVLLVKPWPPGRGGCERVKDRDSSEEIRMTIQDLHHINLCVGRTTERLTFTPGCWASGWFKRPSTFDDPTQLSSLLWRRAAAGPASALTFFEWRARQSGAPGIGGTHHFASTGA